tara:strand:+ start:627 stop:827 length:201 start_codon:yes stop_codon:yes gene_type:complete
MDKLKELLATILTFTTGLGFYGLGLAAWALGLWVLLGWVIIPAGLVGAFIFKNFKAIVDAVKSIRI